MAYATHLTRDYLEYLGITEVSKDGTKIMKGDKEITQHYDGRYNLITLYDPAIRQATPIELRTNTTGQIHFGVHRIVYCWYNRIIPNGIVIDHINSNKLDNSIDNLQMLTPKENVNKERPESTKEMPCKLNKPRSFYENKLAEYEKLYETAKANKEADRAHNLRSNIAQTRARLRYYDNHKKEVTEMTEFQKDCLELASWKKNFKLDGNKSMWHECCKVEKVIKEKKEAAAPIVKHALEVLHRTFGR
jgi:hypothetical protein